MPWVWAGGIQVPSVATSWTLSNFDVFEVGAVDFSEDVFSFRDSFGSRCRFEGGFRFGEADHPGPLVDDDEQPHSFSDSLDFQRLRVGCSNPFGGKNWLPSIWVQVFGHLPKHI